MKLENGILSATTATAAASFLLTDLDVMLYKNIQAPCSLLCSPTRRRTRVLLV
jgi:hypothetical protein